RERAMSTAYLLAGDEDLREGVKDAQDVGVRVVLLGVESTKEAGNQADTLIQEADEHIVLDKEFWDPFIALKEAPPPEPELDAEPGEEPTSLILEAARVGDAFAKRWLEGAAPEELAGLLAEAPRIPATLDAELLTEARKHVPTRSQPELSKAVRRGF